MPRQSGWNPHGLDWRVREYRTKRGLRRYRVEAWLRPLPLPPNHYTERWLIVAGNYTTARLARRAAEHWLGPQKPKELR